LDVVCSEKVLTYADIKSLSGCIVYKYGGKTGFTTGQLSEIKTFADCGNKRYGHACTFFNQMLIASLSTDRFCQMGDSGALCYMVDKLGKTIHLRPFAMIIIVTHAGDAIVTPLINVFRKLHLDITKGMTVCPITRLDAPQENITFQLNSIRTDVHKMKELMEAHDNKITKQVESQKEVADSINEIKHSNADILNQLKQLVKQPKP